MQTIEQFPVFLVITINFYESIICKTLPPVRISETGKILNLKFDGFKITLLEAINKLSINQSKVNQVYIV
jgi:hypothetical protein